ncbi:MAG: acylneuraminate cytidylyltransferase family protein [Deltaproteobacteria bacterium]|jgi:CMP-N-acetylneuraminic acid synthetase|nr:acylneuraminate cytidylyltransferase family protein [Deltaproteobacteria bacterium]
MIDGLRILVVCPARGGSKGIPNKNLKPFLGIPLVARVGHLVKEIAVVDRAIVSTDSDEIARVAKEAGLDAPFYRPDDLSGDRISDLQVLTHALLEMERLDNVVYDIIVMLQPTSPLRTVVHVKDTIQMLVDGNWDAVWTVSETDSKNHPLKQLTVENGQLDYYDPAGKQVIARQQLVPVYHRNGVAYAIRRRCLLEQKSISGERTGALVLKENLVSIDTLWDLELAEYISRNIT